MRSADLASILGLDTAPAAAAVGKLRLLLGRRERLPGPRRLYLLVDCCLAPAAGRCVVLWWLLVSLAICRPKKWLEDNFLLMRSQN